MAAICFVLSGCAAAGPAYNAQEIPKAPAGKAQIIVYRAGGLLGAGESPTIQINGHDKCELPQGSFFIAEEQPGKADIGLKTYGQVITHGTASAQAGKTVYVEVTVNGGGAVGGGFGAIGALIANEGPYSIRAVPAETARDDLAGTKQSQSCNKI